MFGIGMPELIIIIIVALLVVGPTKLPELARSLGKALGEFRRMADDVKETIQEEMVKEEPKPEEQKTAQAPAPPEGTGDPEGAKPEGSSSEEPARAETSTPYAEASSEQQEKEKKFVEGTPPDGQKPS